MNFMNEFRDAWYVNKVVRVFNSTDVAAILSCPIAKNHNDILIWENYSTREALPVDTRLLTAGISNRLCPICEQYVESIIHVTVPRPRVFSESSWRKFAVEKEHIVALANSNVKETLEGWFSSIKRVGISNYLVIALDDHIVEFTVPKAPALCCSLHPSPKTASLHDIFLAQPVAVYLSNP
ncbi:hypothetical protein V6N13_129723 [Hibiscus sabdariffa]